MGLGRLSLNTATTKGLDIPGALDVAARHGISHVGLWRDRVHETGLDETARLVRERGFTVSSLCRGGFLTAADEADASAALDDNRRAIEEAATLGTRELIMVVGGIEGLVDFTGTGVTAGSAPYAQRVDLRGARERVQERIADLVPFAREHDVRLVLEALHPMYVADRAVISTLTQALDIARPFDARDVGVVVDAFHVWWDPALEGSVARAGKEGRIASYQVCDYQLPIAADPLLSRGYMGDGFVDFTHLTTIVKQAGYDGPVEVEIFRKEIWEADADEVVGTVVERYLELVAPHL
ncbi:sugar phosphate isomerase/epimerase [Micrococcales bacterium 31B]|nr:sugar phosphate isomerase/epimerase [Micrococcales bacterium 31B]